MTNNESLSLLKSFLEDKATLIKKIYHNTDWQYTSFEELILKLGVPITVKDLPLTVKQGNPRQCYFNCQKLAFKRKNFIYVEGYALALNVGLPLPHAWLITPEGDAIDPTWNPPGAAYFGVPFSTQWLRYFLAARKQISKTDNISIFQGNYIENQSLLKHGIPSDGLANIS